MGVAARNKKTAAKNSSSRSSRSPSKHEEAVTTTSLTEKTTHDLKADPQHKEGPERASTDENSAQRPQPKNLETKRHDDEGGHEYNLRGSYWLTRIVIVRYMGFIYFVAFLVSLQQNKQLLGKKGLLPADVYLSQLKERIGSSHSWTLISAAPTIFWFVDFEGNPDYWLDFVAWAGLGIASFMIISASGNWILLFIEWILYHSLVNIGQRWFSFGWESQVLETGFLAIFLCPVFSLARFPTTTPSSKIVLFSYKWLIFRIMLGAGLIKIRGDKCWRDLTCMNYHYETQPVPNPVSYFMHQSPEPMHKVEVLSNHFIELLAPVLLLLPHRRLSMIAGAIQIFFQVVLIISGNLSFLNWLTILPSLACFDDASLVWMFDRSSRLKAKITALNKKPVTNISVTIRKVLNVSFGVLIAYLSIPVIQNLVSSRQLMNTSFSPLRIVNTYGAFGSITKTRTEVIFKGTNSTDPESPKAVWEEYEFKCKPGDPKRQPCLISPYHYRLDWLMWFAAFQDYQHNPWLVHLAAKFLVNDKGTESLIAHNPFHGRPPPRFVRADHYRYSFTKLGSKKAQSGLWWERKKIGQYLPAVSLDMVSPAIENMGWPSPRV